MSEPIGTQSIMTRLEAWASNDSLITPPDRFACPHYGACNASINQELREGEGCCMSYVGPHYGNGFRLAVVGMDHGDFEPATFEIRQRGILKCYIEDRKKFNPHYAGVVKTAAAVLGKSGTHCQTFCTKSCDSTNNTDCVIRRIAQPNLVKCVPHTQGNRTSRASRVMKVNCVRHLVAELRILLPKMIIFHGIQSRWIVRPEFERVGVDLVAIEECADAYGPVLYRSTELGAHILFLYHPSRGWLDRQWPQVKTWIGYLRGHTLIPE
jgi:hypothetical protein